MLKESKNFYFVSANTIINKCYKLFLIFTYLYGISLGYYV